MQSSAAHFYFYLDVVGFFLMPGVIFDFAATAHVQQQGGGGEEENKKKKQVPSFLIQSVYLNPCRKLASPP